MKALIYVFTALYLLFTSACEKSDNKYAFGKPVKVFEGETIRIADNIISVTAVEINDYRCPENAVCVWQGYAFANLSVSSGNDTLKNVNLCTGGCSMAALDTTEIIELNNKRYSIRLNDIGEEKRQEYVRLTISPQ